jgi:hypothetical protein
MNQWMQKRIFHFHKKRGTGGWRLIRTCRLRVSTSADDTDVVVDSDDSEEEEEESLPLPTGRQMEQALETLRRGLYGRGFNDFSVMNKVERAVAHVGTESVTQSKISLFFNVNGN